MLVNFSVKNFKSFREEAIADYKTDKGKARNTEVIEQNYIEGKYGGVQFPGDLENFLEQYSHEQQETGTTK